jgi:hypothetical protein
MLGGIAAMPTTKQARRRRMAAFALLVAVVVAIAAIVSSGGGEPKRLVVGGGDGSGEYDPLAWDSDKESDLVGRAAAGFSDPIWDKSPGGVVATARRTAHWRPLIEQAAKANGVDPDTLEAIVLLESAGRSDAIAGGGTNVEGAVGLTQIVASTATSLLRMRVDLERSHSLTERIESATSASQSRKLERARRKADERFNPAVALAAGARYLADAKKRFGREDMAVASYHMGIGNLEHVLSLYKEQGGGDDPSYAQVYFDSTPLRKPRAYQLLSGFGDDSSTYLWRVTAAREIMAMSRKDPKKLAHLEELERDAGPGERRLYPDGAPNVDGVSSATKSVVAYIKLGVAHLRFTSVGGVRIVVSRHYQSRKQALAFQYLLDRLQAWNLIAWGRSGSRLAIVV